MRTPTRRCGCFTAGSDSTSRSPPNPRAWQPRFLAGSKNLAGIWPPGVRIRKARSSPGRSQSREGFMRHSIVAVLAMMMGFASVAQAVDVDGKWGVGAGLGNNFTDVTLIHGRSPSSAWLFDVAL